ncbi:MAG: GNAT family N-acetyltransferase [Oliverpabstia sp.]
MKIRKMCSDDIDKCAEILCSVYNNELWLCRWDKETAMEYLNDYFEGKKFIGYVAEEDGELIAGIFAHEKVWWNNSEVFVEEMFVRPDKQGKGIGTALLREIKEYVKKYRLAGITLSTNKYAPAVRFYEKNGFANCEHVVFMAKEM